MFRDFKFSWVEPGPVKYRWHNNSIESDPPLVKARRIFPLLRCANQPVFMEFISKQDLPHTILFLSACEHILTYVICISFSNIFEYISWGKKTPPHTTLAFNKRAKTGSKAILGTVTNLVSVSLNSDNVPVPGLDACRWLGGCDSHLCTSMYRSPLLPD